MRTLRLDAQLVVRRLTRRHPMAKDSAKPHQQSNDQEAETRASHRVWEIPELLTLILSHLDQCTLLTTTQRVCKAWYETIHTSPCLRRHLFLHEPILRPASQPARSIINPLVEKILPGWITTVAMTQDTRMSSDEYETAISRKRFAASLPFLFRGHDNPFLRRGASWLDMQIADPPMTKVAIHNMSVYKLFYLERSTFQQLFPSGIRILDLYALILQRACRESTHRFQTIHPLEGNIQPEHITAGSILSSPYFQSLKLANYPLRTYHDPCVDGAELLVEIHSSKSCCAHPPTDEAKEFWNDCGTTFFDTEYYDRCHLEDFSLSPLFITPNKSRAA